MVDGEDVCYHVAPEGQSLCACQNYTEWLRAIITIQGSYIRDLERRLRGEPRPVRLE